MGRGVTQSSDTEKNDGVIVVASQPGEGTTFQIYFPAHIPEVDKSSEWSANLPRGIGQRILFVDDEIRLADIGQQLLNCIGYRTDTCASAEEALELIRADPTSYSLVVTDQVMSGMSGTDLAQAIRKIRQELPVILVTGEIDGIPLERLEKWGVWQLLPKPVSLRVLADAVAQMLATKVE